ncbi:hypothetical protein ACF3NR_10715 [Vaginella massiliensis]|uniref:hypothetical protein n=1 Tax=Vaginella massiliensis TaxID=1816680 RepID=UPI00083802DC|nr:hypothetical protein [Vaginella massiliensis]
MIKIIRLIAFFMVAISCWSFVQQQYLIWNENQKLDYNDFKGKAPKDIKLTGGNLYTEFSYTRSQKGDEVPRYTIVNRMDQTKSWINRKDPDMLAQKQLQFDIAELYARKIRKSFRELNQKKVKNDNEYKSVILKNTRLKEKINAKYQHLLAEQPKLLEIVNKSYQDSLKIYKEFAVQ